MDFSTLQCGATRPQRICPRTRHPGEECAVVQHRNQSRQMPEGSSARCFRCRGLGHATSLLPGRFTAHLSTTPLEVEASVRRAKPLRRLETGDRIDPIESPACGALAIVAGAGLGQCFQSLGTQHMLARFCAVDTARCAADSGDAPSARPWAVTTAAAGAQHQTTLGQQRVSSVWYSRSALRPMRRFGASSSPSRGLTCAEFGMTAIRLADRRTKISTRQSDSNRAGILGAGSRRMRHTGTNSFGRRSGFDATLGLSPDIDYSIRRRTYGLDTQWLKMDSKLSSHLVGHLDPTGDWAQDPVVDTPVFWPARADSIDETADGLGLLRDACRRWAVTGRTLLAQVALNKGESRHRKPIFEDTSGPLNRLLSAGHNHVG